MHVFGSIATGLNQVLVTCVEFATFNTNVKARHVDFRLHRVWKPALFHRVARDGIDQLVAAPITTELQLPGTSRQLGTVGNLNGQLAGGGAVVIAVRHHPAALYGEAVHITEEVTAEIAFEVHPDLMLMVYGRGDGNRQPAELIEGGLQGHFIKGTQATQFSALNLFIHQQGAPTTGERKFQPRGIFRTASGRKFCGVGAGNQSQTVRQGHIHLAAFNFRYPNAHQLRQLAQLLVPLIHQLQGLLALGQARRFRNSQVQFSDTLQQSIGIFHALLHLGFYRFALLDELLVQSLKAIHQLLGFTEHELALGQRRRVFRGILHSREKVVQSFVQTGVFAA